MNGPNPNDRHPIKGVDQICFLNKVVTNPDIIVGDYTYYDDPEDVANFERQVLYLFPFIDDQLLIGKFCALARGVTFIMNGANHAMGGFSTYPFYIFGKGWEDTAPAKEELPFKGNTIVENDVWIGYGATIMPGVRIGNGAIVAAQSVVVNDVPDYAIVGGNPARILRHRFDSATIEALLEIAWWNWDVEKITRNLKDITQANLNAPKNCQ